MGEIEVDKAPPIGELRALDGYVQIPAADVVDENVDGRLLGEHAVAEVLASGGLRHVRREGPRLAPAFANFSCRSLEGVTIARH